MGACGSRRWTAAWLFASVSFGASADELGLAVPVFRSLAAGADVRLTLPALEPGSTYALDAAILAGDLADGERVVAELALPGARSLTKTLHAGDPGIYVPFRIAAKRPADAPAPGGDRPALTLRRGPGGPERSIDATVQLVRLGGPEDAASFEAEPNDSHREANPLEIGRTVEGGADDVDYLDNREEGKRGLDWFRFEIASEEPSLVFFELDVLDRDVSMNLRVYAPDPAGGGGVTPFTEGKDPMEIVHDRERERYSKAITRIFRKGTYYLEVNANHPRYILRSCRYPSPPYADPATAVAVGCRYVMDVGDAWFAQIPREGHIYRRVQNMHETATRCTACHPSVFSTEPNLVAHRNGYPIAGKSNFRYVVERLYNSITPQYGPDRLWWQRFIAIPLQAQGKQGGILIDFERQISGLETGIVPRFGPFLRAVWSDRKDLPKDEVNGVMPLDSKFGFAWRDWRVLRECYRRTGDESYARAADRIKEIFVSPEAEKRIETLQDRMHIVLGLTLLGGGAGESNPYRARIEGEIERLMALQNADGGWHEEGKPGRPSAVYATGQMLYTLIEAGRRAAEDPRLKKGLDWLLSQQEPFGGWMQTTTHENFRTPMRETRYALMALASAYPRPGGPLQGMGNLDGGPARLPSPAAPPAALLADLENLWDVPADRRTEFTAALSALLDRPEPPVRAAAAAALGRVGGPEAARPLLARFRDPVKEAWRAAAWALRQLGNRGLNADPLRDALASPDPLVRRGAARVFAYQFQGMDQRLDIARVFVGLTADPDLLTRLQAIRTLRQWWYRTWDSELRALIVRTFIDRMAVPEETAAVRKNLSENMYILLDENIQSGGVHLEKNNRDVPAEITARTIEARKRIERDILLNPILSALASGGALQRKALLDSFDGSMFEGRAYARNPRGMLDVGNDREFGFYYAPEPSLLDRTLGALLAEEKDAGLLRRALQLAGFFEMAKHTPSDAALGAFLRLLTAESDGVRAAAREVVRKDLQLRAGSSGDVLERAARLVREGDAETRAALLTAVGRSHGVYVSAILRAAVQGVLDAQLKSEAASADLLPLVGTPLLDDAQALAVLRMSWQALRDRSAAEQIVVLEALAGRQGLVGCPQPAKEAFAIMEEAAVDPQVAVRERLFCLLGSLETFRKSRSAAFLLFAGLADESPVIRADSLKLARENEAVWNEEDAHEYVLKLLVDADPKIRKAALDAVGDRKLIAAVPRYAPRVKAVMDGDPALRSRAEALLREAGLDPAAVTADAEVAAPRLPEILFYRDRVNAFFYQKGRDGKFCAKCHATHTIFGLAETPPDGRALTDAEIVGNYRSILKVINTGDPEQSLVLRKPLSPFGQGQASEDSPTGITHVGGTRWPDGTSNKAYQAVLAFIRTARLPQAAARRAASTDSFTPENPPALAIDGNPDTFWHTEHVGASPGYPHELVVELDAPREVAGVTYVPRADAARGRVKQFEIRLSADGKTWGPPAARGEWANDALPKTVFVPQTRARYVKLRGLSEATNLPYMSAAELEVIVARENIELPHR